MNHFFGQNLKTLRLKKNISQEALGKLLHKWQKTIGNWETGYSQPSLEELVKLAAYFDTSVDKFLKYEIETDPFKSKSSRNISENNVTENKDNLSAITRNVKRMLQDSQKENKTTNSEIVWRDKYISILESHLTTETGHISFRPTIRDVVNQISIIQKMLAELSV